MNHHHIITVTDDGTTYCLGNPLGLQGEITKRRWSAIIPVNPLLRVLFYLVRGSCGDDGAMAEWTRRWPCRWELTLLQGKRNGQKWRSTNRQALIELEHEEYFLSEGIDL